MAAVYHSGLIVIYCKVMIGMYVFIYNSRSSPTNLFQEALLKFRKEFSSIRNKDEKKISCEGYFINAKGEGQWDGVSSAEFGNIIKHCDKLRIRVYHSHNDTWE
jgi:hypothetical protein